jgi:hypothetical protein
MVDRGGLLVWLRRAVQFRRMPTPSAIVDRPHSTGTVDRVRSSRFWMVGIAVAALPLLLTGCYDWLQWGGNSAHSGYNSVDKLLTVDNVGGLHLIWQATLPATADGAPMFVSQVETPQGTKNLIFLTTKTGTLQAHDLQNGAMVWSISFAAGSCRVNNGSTPCFTTSSPLVDPNKQFVYTYGLDGKVHKVNLGDGTEVIGGGWPEVATLKGFDEKGSSALAMATGHNGVTYLYVTNAGYPGDRGDYQGHLTAINLSNGSQQVFNTLCSNQAVHFVTVPGSPDCPEVTSGVWARPGVVYDSATDLIYLATGNGTFDPANHHWGDTVIALHPDGSGANGDPVDTWTPTNYQTLQTADLDLGSTLPAIFDAPSGSTIAHLGLQGGKDGMLHLLNMGDLSGQGGPGNLGGEIATFPLPQGGGIFPQPTVWIDPSDSSTWVFVPNFNGTTAYRAALGPGNGPQLAQQWRTAVSGTTALIVNGILFLASGNRIGAYNATTGAQLWADTTLGGVHWQSPVVALKTLLMEDNSGHLNAYQP